MNCLRAHEWDVRRTRAHEWDFRGGLGSIAGRLVVAMWKSSGRAGGAVERAGDGQVCGRGLVAAPVSGLAGGGRDVDVVALCGRVGRSRVRGWDGRGSRAVCRRGGGGVVEGAGGGPVRGHGLVAARVSGLAGGGRDADVSALRDRVGRSRARGWDGRGSRAVCRRGGGGVVERVGDGPVCGHGLAAAPLPGLAGGVRDLDLTALRDQVHENMGVLMNRSRAHEWDVRGSRAVCRRGGGGVVEPAGGGPVRGHGLAAAPVSGLAGGVRDADVSALRDRVGRSRAHEWAVRRTRGHEWDFRGGLGSIAGRLFVAMWKSSGRAGGAASCG